MLLVPGLLSKVAMFNCLDHVSWQQLQLHS